MTLWLQLIDRRPGTAKVTTVEILEKVSVALFFSTVAFAFDACSQANREFGDVLPEAVKQVLWRS